jgi:hypothetical protein
MSPELALKTINFSTKIGDNINLPTVFHKLYISSWTFILVTFIGPSRLKHDQFCFGEPLEPSRLYYEYFLVSVIDNHYFSMSICFGERYRAITSSRNICFDKRYREITVLVWTFVLVSVTGQSWFLYKIVLVSVIAQSLF